MSDNSTIIPIINEYSVCSSAPGKVILFGEHAVVYGVPAIAASLSDLRITVLITPIITNDDNVYIHMPDLLRKNNDTNSSNSNKNNNSKTSDTIRIPLKSIINLYPKLQTPPTSDCAKRLEQVVRSEAQMPNSNNNNDDDDNTENLLLHAVIPLLYLIHQLIVVTDDKFHGLEVYVRSKQLPVGAGLGSSAAFGVACAGALMQLQQQQQRNQQSSTSSSSSSSTTTTTTTTTREIQHPSKEMIQKINEYAYYSEIILHGNPSGIDNAVSAYGGAILFDKKDPQQINMEFIRMEKQLPLLLVYTNEPRSTKKLVAGVRTLYNQYPTIMLPIIQSMGNIAESFCTYILSNGIATCMDNNKSLHSMDSTSANAIGTTPTASTSSIPNNTNHSDPSSSLSSPVLDFVRMNQHLLRCVGVSHPSLDYICTIVDQIAYNYAAAKLTGAGGGGCAIILFDTPSITPTTTINTDNDLITTIQQQIQSALMESTNSSNNDNNNNGKKWKFECFTSTIGGDGVLFVSPSEFVRLLQYDDDQHQQPSTTSASTVVASQNNKKQHQHWLLRKITATTNFFWDTIRVTPSTPSVIILSSVFAALATTTVLFLQQQLQQQQRQLIK